MKLEPGLLFGWVQNLLSCQVAIDNIRNKSGTWLTLNLASVALYFLISTGRRHMFDILGRIWYFLLLMFLSKKKNWTHAHIQPSCSIRHSLFHWWVFGNTAGFIVILYPSVERFNITLLILILIKPCITWSIWFSQHKRMKLQKFVVIYIH